MDQYRVLGVLGEGAYGIVLKCQNVVGASPQRAGGFVRGA
jgi:hypothetical protein